jgi:MFS family permease
MPRKAVAAITNSTNRIFYGWWIVLSTSIICMIGYGTWLYSFGVFLKPMCAEFGWTRAMTAGAYSLRSIEGGVAAPIVGWAVDKYGARIVIAIGAIISGFGFVMMYFIESLFGFYVIYGIVLSIGMSAMLYLPAWTVIAKWFMRRLSLALGILSVGAGIGGLVCAPAAAYLITNFGWRAAFVVLGIVMWVVALPLALLIRSSPDEKGMLPYGSSISANNAEQKSAASTDKSAILADTSAVSADTSFILADTEEPAPHMPNDDYTLKEALSSSSFWLLCTAFFFQGVAHSVVTVHTVPALTDAGIPVEKAALSIGILTAVSIIGRLGCGYFGDIIAKRYLFMVAYGLMGSGLLVLMDAHTMPVVYTALTLFGIGFGGMVPLMPGIRVEYFGRKALGKIQGFMSPVVMLSGAAGPILAGYLFDTTGSYRTSFLCTGFLTFLAMVAIFFARPIKRPAPKTA